MHKLQNGSQVSVRPQRKPLVGLGGYFSESNDQGAPSYPGQDWFNDCTDEFINALDEMGITYDQERLDHLARAFAAVRSQEWNANVNYGIGQEVVRNGLRYIARAASGPGNGGGAEPLFTNEATEYWNEKINDAHIRRYPENEWVKILSFPAGSTQWQGVTLELIGGDDRGFSEGKSIFHVDVYVNRQSDAPSAPINVRVIPRNIGFNNPTLHTRTSGGVSELWVNTATITPRPLVVINKTAYSVIPSLRVEVGILSTTKTAPIGTTLVSYDTGYQFASIPIGMEVAFDTPPPTDDPRFRFVKLTHGDAYNTGLLTSQTLSGSAPELVSTAVISAAQSPINGQTIHMINTMQAFVRPSTAAGVLTSSSNKSHNHTDRFAHGGIPGGSPSFGSAFAKNFYTPSDILREAPPNGIWDGAAAGLATGTEGENEARPYNISKVFYKRIY
ncbi:hypothetical protein VCSRO150_1213 [Vibrio cholerae]|nr:hypothetical protein VCSRO150_1213 [Vibrio cholerae]